VSKQNPNAKQTAKDIDAIKDAQKVKYVEISKVTVMGPKTIVKIPVKAIDAKTLNVSKALLLVLQKNLRKKNAF
jgi:hypothetical protein